LSVPEKASQIVTQTSIGLSIVVSISTSVITMSSPQLTWSTINQYQLLMLITIIGAYIPDNVLTYLHGMELRTLTSSFIPFEKIPVLKQYYDFFK
jgi:hypothetical protein